MEQSKPYVKNYFDDAEEELIQAMENAINQPDYVPVSNLTSERYQMLRAAARGTLHEKTIPITLRLPQTDLIKLKAQAMREGMPYQTWIKSILHKSVVA